MIAFTQKLADPFVGIAEMIRRFTLSPSVPSIARTEIDDLDARMLADIGADRDKMAFVVSRYR